LILPYNTTSGYKSQRKVVAILLRFIIINMPLIFLLRGRLRLENARSGAWGQKTSSKHRRRPKSLVGKTRDTLWLRQDHSKK